MAEEIEESKSSWNPNSPIKQEPVTRPLTCLVLPRGYKVIYQCSCCNLQFLQNTFYKNHIEKCHVAKQQELEQSYVDQVLENEFSSEQSTEVKKELQKKKIVISVHKGNPQYELRKLEDTNAEPSDKPKKRIYKKKRKLPKPINNAVKNCVKNEVKTKFSSYLFNDKQESIEISIQDISPSENVECTQFNTLYTDKKSEIVEIDLNSEIPKPTKRKKESESSLETKQSCEITEGKKKKRSFLDRIKKIAPFKAKEEVQNEDQKVYEFHDAEMEVRKMQAKLAIANKKKTCPYCNILFDDPMDVLRHKREVHYFQKKHVPAAELEKYFEVKDMSKCPICERPIKGGFKSNYIKHLITHKVEYSFQCTICKMMFRRKDHQEIHEARHII